MKLMKNEKGVSPVIGVILMVAITVILAAVIASFVFGLGSRVSRTAPIVSATLEDASDELDDAVDTVAVLTFMAASENIPKQDIRLVVRFNDTYSDSKDGGEFTAGSAEGAYLSFTWKDLDGSETLCAGDVIEIAERTTNVKKNSDFRVMIIHIPTGSTVYDSTTRVA